MKSGRTTRAARKSFDSFSSRFEDSFPSFRLFCLKGGLDRGGGGIYTRNPCGISFCSFTGEAKEKGERTIDEREREGRREERVRTASGEAWKKGDHTRRDKEERRGEAKGVDNTHIYPLYYPHPSGAVVSPLLAFHPFCPRTLSNHSEREQPTEQAVPRLLNVIKSSLPP